MEPQGDIALIGLAVMGRNLILNMNDHGFTVVAHNRTAERVDEFLAGVWQRHHGWGQKHKYHWSPLNTRNGIKIEKTSSSYDVDQGG